MRASVAIATLLVLTGCQKASAKAEQEAAMVEKTGDQSALCGARRKVASAYLDERNDEAYRRAKLSADTTCMLNDLRKQNGG